MELQYQSIPTKRVIEISSLVSATYMDFPNDFVFPLESHRCWELNFVDYGSIRTSAGTQEFLLQKQDMILYPPLVEHGIVVKTEDTPNLITIAFESDSPLLYRLGGRVIHLPVELQKLLSEILHRVYTIFPNALPVNTIPSSLGKSNETQDLTLQLVIQTLEDVFLRLLCDGEQEDHATKSQKLTAENQQLNLSQAVAKYIEQHVSEKLTLDKISKHFNISVGKLCRDVKASTNFSIHEMIAKERLKIAKHMIKKEQYNFTEIAEQLGFSSLHYFSQWFKNQTNMSPTEYATSVKGRSET